MYRIADISDLENIKKIGLNYHFIQDAAYELQNDNKFRWTIKEENKAIVAVHRTYIVNETGYFGGIYLNSSLVDTFSCLEIINFSINDLKKQPIKFLYSVCDPSAPKKTILKYFGFEKLHACYMLFLSGKESIKKFSERAYNVKFCNWEIKKSQEFNPYKKSSELYYSEIEYDSFWFFDESEHSYINWTIRGNTLEVLSCHSKKENYDFTEGIIGLVIYSMRQNINLEQIRVMIPAISLLSYIRLCQYGFSLCRGNQLQNIYYKRIDC